MRLALRAEDAEAYPSRSPSPISRPPPSRFLLVDGVAVASLLQLAGTEGVGVGVWWGRRNLLALEEKGGLLLALFNGGGDGGGCKGVWVCLQGGGGDGGGVVTPSARC